MAPQAVDQFCLGIAVLAPAYVVLRFRRARFTIPLGTVIPWVTLCIAGHLLSILDPEREGGIIDSIWFLFGWLPSLIYASLLYGVRRLFLFLIRSYVRPTPPYNALQ